MNTKITTTLIIGLLLIATLFAGCSSQTTSVDSSNSVPAGQDSASATSGSSDADLALVTSDDTEIGEMI